MDSEGSSPSSDRQALTEAPPSPTLPTPRKFRRILDRFRIRVRRSAGGAKPRPSLVVCIALGLFAAGLALSIPPRPFRALDWKLYDLRMKWRNALLPSPISRKIVVVAIDELDHYIYYSEFPSRWIYARLLEELRRYGPEAVAFDVVFSYPAPMDDLFAYNLRDVPGFLAVGFRSAPFSRQPEGHLPADLEALRDGVGAIRSPDQAWQKVQLLRDYWGTLQETHDSLAARPDPPADTLRELALRLAWIRYLADMYLDAYYTTRCGRPYEKGQHGNPNRAVDVLLPSAPLFRAAAGSGFINVEKGDEEVIHRVPMVYEYKNRLFPSLDLSVVLAHYGATFDDCTIRFGQSIRFPIRRGGTGIKRIPIDDRGEYLVNFRQGEDYLRRPENRTVSFYTHPQYAAERAREDLKSILNGSIVLVGETSQGSTDVQPIPLQPLFPLVGVHANVLDNLLNDDHLHPVPGAVEVALVIGMGALLGLLFARRDSREASHISLGLVVIYLLAQFAMFLYLNNLVLPITRVVGTAGGAYVFLMLYTVGVIERDRRLVKDVFLKSVSPRIGEEILRRYNDPSLWASRREISVLFVDIRGFTRLSERLAPDALVELLDVYYDTVSEIVFRHDGQVNKFIGDAVMALYGALPGEAPNHAERAVKTAIDIHLALAALAARLRAQGKDSALQVGVGVNTGEVVVGTVGRRKIRIEYTALGDTVNTAERLQGQAGAGKVYVGQKTVAALRSQAPQLANRALRFQRVEGLTLKGKTQSVDVYQLLFEPQSLVGPREHTPEATA